MPVLAAFLGSVLTGFVTWFATWASKQVAIRLALIAMFVALTSALWGAVSALAGGISIMLPDALTVPATWLWPTNADACAAAYISARVLIWAYHMDLWALKLRAI